MPKGSKAKRIIVLICITALGFVFYKAGQRYGYLPSKSQRITYRIAQEQMKLELAPVENRLLELEAKAQKKLLTEAEKREAARLRQEAENIQKRYEAGNLTKLEPKADEEQIRQIKAAFEKLVTQRPAVSSRPVKDQWQRLIANKRVTIVYSQENLSAAADIAQRLCALGAQVSYDSAGEVSFAGEPGNIYYQFSDFETAAAIQAAVADLASFRLTSIGFRGSLLIWN